MGGFSLWAARDRRQNHVLRTFSVTFPSNHSGVQQIWCLCLYGNNWSTLLTLISLTSLLTESVLYELILRSSSKPLCRSTRLDFGHLPFQCFRALTTWIQQCIGFDAHFSARSDDTEFSLEPPPEATPHRLHFGAGSPVSAFCSPPAQAASMAGVEAKVARADSTG